MNQKKLKKFVKKFNILNLILCIFVIFTLTHYIDIYNVYHKYVEDISTSRILDAANLVEMYLYVIIPLIIGLLLYMYNHLYVIQKKNFLYNSASIIYIVIFIFTIYIQGALYNLGVFREITYNYFKLHQDLTLLVIGIQIIYSAFFLIRGFGIYDKEMLDISNINDENLNMQNTIKLSIDASNLRNEFKNTRKSFFAYLFENKFIIIVLILVTILALSLPFVIKEFRTEKPIDQSVNFTKENFKFTINKTYLTNKSYSGKNIVQGKYLFLIVNMNVDTLSDDDVMRLDSTKIHAVADGTYYQTTSKYNSYFLDMGNKYLGDRITEENSNLRFVYVINKSSVKNIQLDVYGKLIDLKPDTFTNIKDVSNSSLGKNLIFENSTLKNNSITINKFDTKSIYSYPYEICNKDCIKFNEYISPINNDLILRINANYINNSDDYFTLTNFLDNFGYIKYTVDGIENEIRISKTQVLNNTENDDYFISVKSEVATASSIDLVFNIRNYIYTYKLK
ncbi:MAG: hypothetical protein ACK5HL_02255 [Bacilli bacterium]